MEASGPGARGSGKGRGWAGCSGTRCPWEAPLCPHSVLNPGSSRRNQITDSRTLELTSHTAILG